MKGRAGSAPFLTHMASSSTPTQTLLVTLAPRPSLTRTLMNASMAAKLPSEQHVDEPDLAAQGAEVERDVVDGGTGRDVNRGLTCQVEIADRRLNTRPGRDSLQCAHLAFHGDG